MIIERGLHLESRWLKLELKIEDKPGELSRVTQILGQLRANVLEVVHDRLNFDCSPGQTLLRILLETRGSDHATQVIKTLREENYVVKVIE